MSRTSSRSSTRTRKISATASSTSILLIPAERSKAIWPRWYTRRMTPYTPPPKDWREGRRLRAWDLHAAGWKQRDIAAALGVSEGAVSQWLRRGREGGVAALRHRRPPGA